MTTIEWEIILHQWIMYVNTLGENSTAYFPLPGKQ